MGSIIFVHGTGVRQKDYAESLGRIRDKLADLEDWAVHPCLWGDSFGAKLGKGGISIPDFDATLSSKSLSEEERLIALWSALYEDPLYELRLLEIHLNPLQNRSFNQLTAFQQVEPLVKNLGHSEKINACLQKCEIDQTWDEAIRRVSSSPEYRSVLSKAESINTALRECVARALVAMALSLRKRKLLFEPMGGVERDKLVESIVEDLGGRDMGAPSWFAQKALKALSPPFTWYVRRQRGQVSLDGYALAGDILLYQARGQAIRQFIRQTVENATPPVVLLAHSLGGVACVDLLIEEDLSEKVGLLITVGSQAPFFYEMNALVSLPLGEPIKSHFPRNWLNIYDPRDFLSYLARGVFHGPDIKDVRVDNREPFPQSHSAYWSNDQVWLSIREELQ